MAKDFKDHVSIGGGRAHGNRIIPRIVFAILLVTIAILGYSYWALLSSHRETRVKMTLLRADYDAEQAGKAELTKVMDSCKDELKKSREDLKKVKDSETALEEEIKTLKGMKETLENEKKLLEENLKKQISECQENSKKEVSDCTTSCDKKLNEAKVAAEAACQRLQVVPVSTVPLQGQERNMETKLSHGDGQQN